MSQGASNLSSFSILVTYSEVMDSIIPMKARVPVITEEQDILFSENTKILRLDNIMNIILIIPDLYILTIRLKNLIKF